MMFDDDEQIVATQTQDFSSSGDKGSSSRPGEIKVKTFKKSEAPLEETKFKVMLELTGNESGNERPGLDLVMVLDVSGSMEVDGRLERTKIAMQSVIKNLSPIDRLSVVTFSNSSNRLCPLRQMTENSQAEIENLVFSLDSGGGTNIQAGLEMGLQVLNNRRYTSGRVVAIMLLCDSDQNHGDVARVEVGNVPIYTFGLGVDYHPEVLNKIANNSAGGTFSVINDLNELTEAFSQCLAGLLTVAVQDLKVTFKQVNSTIENVSAGNYRQSNDVGSVTVSLGDLYEKELRKVIVCLLLPAVSSTQDGTNVLEISYTYSVRGEVIYCPPRLVAVSRIGISQEPEREEVKIEEIRLQTAQKIKKARIMADNKQLEDAMDMILEAHNLLDKPNNQLIERLKYELQQLLNSMETQDIYDKFGLAFALSCETSHDRQRFAAKGHIKSGPSSRTKVEIINEWVAPLEETRLKVGLDLTGNESGIEKHGLDLVTVLDVSLSMGGETLEKMKIAMQSVIKNLKPIDRLSVVTLSTDSKSLCPLSYMSKNYRGEIEKLVNNLKAQGQGNISAGLQTGLKVLNDRMYTSGRVVAIMLLSDGGQNPQFPDAITKVKVGNVPVYTFDLGTDPKLLESIADNSGVVTFTNVQTLDNLSEEFSQCLARLHTVEVQDLKVTLKQVDSVIDSVYVYARDYLQSRNNFVGSVTVSFGKLYKEEGHVVAMYLILPDVSSTQCADILKLSYTYSFGGELIRTKPRIITIIRRPYSAPMIREARVATAKQLEIANKMIIEAQKLLQNEVDETMKSEVQQLKRLMNSQKPYIEQRTVKVIIDEIHLLTAESGEGTIRSLENSPSSSLSQASTVDRNNDVREYPIEILLDRTVVRERTPELLNRSDNYADWRDKVKQYLEELNVWKVIEEPPTETTESIENVDMGTAIQKLKQFRENWMALILINKACGFPINLQIIDLDSARAAWETLATTWEQGPIVESFLSAAERDDWRIVESLDLNYELATARIPSSRSTVLHLASLAGKVDIVKKLVGLMKEEDLEIQDKDGYTALANASINGNTKIAKCLVRKNMKLVSIPNCTKLLPVVIAIMNGNKEMASYLYSVTPDEVLANKGNINGATLLTYSIRLQFHDITFDLIQKYPLLAVALDHYGQSALYQLACTPSAFRSGSQLKFWQKLMYICVPVQHSDWEINDTRLSVPHESVSKSNWSGCRGILQQIASIASRSLAVLGIKRIYEMKLVHYQSRGLLRSMYRGIRDLDDDEVNGIINALHEAAAKGVVELIDEVLKRFPELRRFRDKQGSTIFMKAVEFRQEGVFSLLQGFAYKDKMIDWVDDRGENLLHKLKYSSVDKISNIQGAVLKIQKELQWLEEIKPMMSRDSIEKQNSEEDTPSQLFRESHGELMKNAEKWMYNTANSCIIVGVLVVTIMFAAAFTVPGGNDQNTGSPLYLRKRLFKVFIISDAVSLFSSTTSVLIFLGILSSRYAERDFLKSLPRKMIFGLFTLFLSIETMMTAFATTLFMVLHAESKIILPTILSSLAVFPFLLYVGFLFPPLFEFTMSTYGPSIFTRKSKWWFFSFYLNKEVKWLLIG